jgi:UDP-glucose 4-epimerase
MMPGVTVLGGAGFIGSHLVDELLTQGHEVTVLDNLSEGKLENLARWKGNPKLEFVRGDVMDYRQVETAVDQRDWVFHLAAMSRIQPGITDPMLAWTTNMMGTANVLEACRKRGVKRVVYSASSSAYGMKNTPPLVETMPTDCLNPYSLSKKLGEEMMDMYHKLYGLSTISLRYFNVYGPRHQEEGSYATVIAVFRKQKRLGEKLTIVGDGEQKRDFTFVSDVVRANIMSAMNYDVNGVFNIGTGENYSINEIANIIGGDSVHIPPRPAEARYTLANIQKAQTILGWRPQVNLKQGLEIIDMYEKANRKSLIIVPR